MPSYSPMNFNLIFRVNEVSHVESVTESVSMRSTKSDKGHVRLPALSWAGEGHAEMEWMGISMVETIVQEVSHM